MKLSVLNFKMRKTHNITFKTVIEVEAVYNLDKHFACFRITATCIKHDPRPQFIDRLVTSLYVQGDMYMYIQHIHFVYFLWTTF